MNGIQFMLSQAGVNEAPSQVSQGPGCRAMQFIVHQMANYKPPPITRDQFRDEAVALSNSMSQARVAMELGITRSQVYELLKEAKKRCANEH